MSVMSLRPEEALFKEIAQVMGVMESFIEKDWYVTQIIRIIANVQHDGFDVIFSGGSALSKAHQLLQRFSEDVDFRARIQNKPNTRSSRREFKNSVVHALRHEGFCIEDSHVNARNSNSFFSVYLNYKTYFQPEIALRPGVLIEITVQDTQLTPIPLPVSSFVNTYLNQSPEVERINCINPVESAADKLSAIAWRIPDRIRDRENDDPSLVRHIHDLAILKETALSHRGFFTLVKASMEQDKKRPKNDMSIIELSASEKLHRMLDTLENDKEYKSEYKQFVEGVSYSNQAPGFSEAMAALKDLIARLVSQH